MKREGKEMDLPLETSSKPFPRQPTRSGQPNDIILNITKFVDAPACIDIKTYLYWHATCRYLWQEYTNLTPSEVQNVITDKFTHINTYYNDSVFYYHEYCDCLLNFCFLFTMHERKNI